MTPRTPTSSALPPPRPAIPRPILLPGLARLWRGRCAIQLGVDPARAAVLELPAPGAARLLDLLDGGHTEQAVLDRAEHLGLGAGQARVVLDTLHAAGLVVPAHTLLPPRTPEPVRNRLAVEAAALALRRRETIMAALPAARPTPPPRTPAQVLRRRADARVVLTGPGRLAPLIAVALAGSGVGALHPELRGPVTTHDLAGGLLTAADLGRSRAAAINDLILRAAPHTVTRAVRPGDASLVVHLGLDRPAGLVAAAHARRREPHLLVVLREGTAIIGPLVPAAGRPCLNCLELHRRDRDPAWPALVAQLATAPDLQVCSTATALAAAGYAAAEVLSHLDGDRPETLGATVEITTPGCVRRRSWPPHPGCHCARRHRGSRPAGTHHRR